MELKRLSTKEFENIGQNIRSERERQNIKQFDMATEIGVGRKVIYKIENGLGSLSVEYLYYISQILGKTMDFFMSMQKDDDPEAAYEESVAAAETKNRIIELLESMSNLELCRIERVITAFLEES